MEFGSCIECNIDLKGSTAKMETRCKAIMEGTTTSVSRDLTHAGARLQKRGLPTCASPPLLRAKAFLFMIMLQQLFANAICSVLAHSE